MGRRRTMLEISLDELRAGERVTLHTNMTRRQVEAELLDLGANLDDLARLEVDGVVERDRG